MNFRSLIRSLIPPIVFAARDRLIRHLYNRGGYGLNALDVRIEKILSEFNQGFFVELGANDGIRQSNTYLLQNKLGWSGLLIEPNPARFEECVINRKLNALSDVSVVCAACVPPSYTKPYVSMINADLMGVALGLDISNSIAKEHSSLGKQFLQHEDLNYQYLANALTLTQVLISVNAPKDIAFLSLDVEGNELSVLFGLDFDLFCPKYILVECRDDTVDRLLVKKGYCSLKKFENGSRCDILFVYKG